MKLLLAEALKKVKSLDEELKRIIIWEYKNSQITFKTPEDKIVPDYNFAQTREKYDKISQDVLRLKKLINKANNETPILYKGLTIADAVVEMTLINSELTYLKDMAEKEKLTSRVDMRNDGIIYTELLYSPEECQEYITRKMEELGQIQIGIDRANVTTYIEY